MTIDHRNERNEFEEIKTFLDSSVNSSQDKYKTTEIWIEETMKYNMMNCVVVLNKDFSASEKQHDDAIAKSKGLEVISTPLTEIKNDDLLYRFQSQISKIDKQKRIAFQIAELTMSLDDVSSSDYETANNLENEADSGVEDTSKWDSGVTIKEENISQQKQQNNSSDRKDWLMDMMKLHTTTNAKSMDMSDREDCIIIKVAPAKFGNRALDRNNLQNILKESCRSNL